MKKIVIAFIPVLHEGYRQFLLRHSDADVLYILGPEIISQFKPLTKEIRLLPPEILQTTLGSLGIITRVEILDTKKLKDLQQRDLEIIFPEEDVSRELAAQYFKGENIVFDSVFLRWDRHQSQAEQPVSIDQEIAHDEFSRTLIKNLSETALKRSSDIWRRIGAAIVKDGTIILSAYNKHLPTEHEPYLHGDPRGNFSQGIHVELSTALHAEAALIAEAARRGIALEGASLYVSTFPCPPCAKQVAFSGIKNLYYSGGYTVLNQDALLKSKGVTIIFVAMKK